MGPLTPLLWALLATPQFVIEPPGCSPPWLVVPALEDMLRADTSSTTRAYVAVLAPSCADLDTLEVSVIRAGRPPRQGQVALAGVPTELKLRTLALLAGELLVEAPIEAPPVRPLAPRPTTTAALAPSLVEDAPAWSLELAVEVRSGLLVGPRLELGRRAGPLRLKVGASTAHHAGERAYTTVVSGHLGAAWSLDVGPVVLDAGPLAELGAAILSGRAELGPALSSSHPIVWLGGRAALCLSVRASLSACATFAAGGYLVGVQGVDGDATTAASSGASVRGALGLAWGW